MKKNRSKSIFIKTFCPVLAALLLLLSCYTIIIHKNVVIYLKQNAFDVLLEQTVNCRDYMEGKMMGQRGRIGEQAEQLVAMIGEIVQERGKTLADIRSDAELNQTILAEITFRVIDILKTGSNTEIFLILDGPAVEQKTESKAGLYIRNSAPGMYTESNSSLLFERGLPFISKEHQISLDSFWEPAFTFAEGEGDYFFCPLEAARENADSDPENFGYWSYGTILNNSDKNVLRYSQPLIGPDGTVFGVIGVGVDETTVIRNIQNSSHENDKTRAYLLARTTPDGSYEPQVIKGKTYNKSAFIGKKLTLSTENGAAYLQGAKSKGEKLCASWQPLSLYNHNTPFENEVWGILSVQQEAELLQGYNSAGRLLGVLMLAGVLVCSVSTFWFSRFISKPIQKMVKELRQSDPNRPIELGDVKIREVNELGDAIKVLSRKVAVSYSRISTIMEMTDVEISVFEYRERENLLFCNPAFYEMMGWEAPKESGEYVDGTSFRERMSGRLLTEKETQSEQIFGVTEKDGTVRWRKLLQTREGDVLLGVLTDITREVIEKQKVEKERDYDLMTGLFNRHAFESRMEELFADTHKIGKAVMMVWDLDNLKYVNDTYGHSVGDEYIIAFAERLLHMNRPGIFSARRSGDEFITFIYGYKNENALERIADQIWEEASGAELLLPDGRSYRVRVSMGKAWYPRDAADYRSMFEYADFAMYMVKHSRKGTMADFDEDIYRENKFLVRGQEAFNNLIENHLVRYMFQPIVSAGDGEIYGYEMLMRSEMDVFKSPMEILRLAHAQSRLYEIEVISWFEAMKSYVDKVEEGVCDRNSKVFINSIANQLLTEEKISLFEETFQDYLSNVVCEFTEEEEGNPEITQSKLAYMEKWKGQIAIDDYGCGYNGESVLLKVAPDIVKIDMGIVQGIDHDGDKQQLVRNLVRYARGRGIRVLGEGVETRGELEMLIKLGVTLFQGYYIAKPSYDAKPPEEAVCREIRALSRMYQY